VNARRQEKTRNLHFLLPLRLSIDLLYLLMLPRRFSAPSSLSTLRPLARPPPELRSLSSISRSFRALSSLYAASTTLPADSQPFCCFLSSYRRSRRTFRPSTSLKVVAHLSRTTTSRRGRLERTYLFPSALQSTLTSSLVRRCGCSSNSTDFPTAALNQAAFGSSMASGKGCGQCFNLTLLETITGTPIWRLNETQEVSIVVKITVRPLFDASFSSN
jgi:hypothetical protein